MSKDNLTIIEPPKGWFNLNLGELWLYRELIWALALRDIKVRYAQAILGVLWSIINPLATLFVLWFVFDRIANLDTGTIPSPVFIMVGITAWVFFSNLVTEGGNSIIGSQNMVKKIYFPKLILPISKIPSALIELGINFFIILILMIIYDVTFSPNLIFLPLFMLLLIIAGMAGGVWFSALTVRYRDFKFILPLILRVGMYATPVAYSSTLVPEQYKSVYNLNPLVSVIEGLRWSLFGTSVSFSAMVVSISALVIFLVFGLLYFSIVERVMADLI